jgi:hypothetical protein
MASSVEKPTVEKISIWVLEAVEQEWRREPDYLKCRPASEVLGPLKSKHSIEDADIDHAIHFMCSPSRKYLTVLNRDDGMVVFPSDNGLAILAKIELSRIEEKEKKKWSRADKIALASLIFSVVSFFAGYYFGDRNAKSSTDNLTTSSQTNSISQSMTVK